MGRQSFEPMTLGNMRPERCPLAGGLLRCPCHRSAHGCGAPFADTEGLMLARIGAAGAARLVQAARKSELARPGLVEGPLDQVASVAVAKLICERERLFQVLDDLAAFVG
jgi:hypothetical protein